MVITLPDPDAPAPPRGLVKVAEVPTWRWLSLAAIAAAIGHLYLNSLHSGSTLGQLLTARSAGIAPPLPLAAGVLVALLGYAVFQHAESQRFIRVYDRVSRHLVAIAVLWSAQLVAAEHSLELATATICLLSVLAISAYLRVHGEIAANRAPRWIGLPFALLVGYSSFVAVGALDASIAAAGCPSVAPTIAMLVALAAITIGSSLRASDPALPTLIAWLVTSVPAAHRSVVNVEGTALIAGALCAAVAVLIVATRFAAPTQHRHPARR